MIVMSKEEILCSNKKPLISFVRTKRPTLKYYSLEASKLIARMYILRNRINKRIGRACYSNKNKEYSLQNDKLFLNVCVSKLKLLGYDPTKVIVGYDKASRKYFIGDNLNLWGGKNELKKIVI